MIELPFGTLPVDFLTLFMSHFRNLAGKPDGRDQGFQATIMKSSVDEVREKEIAFLQGNFDNVRFSENYCFAVHKGDAESLTDLIDRYLSLNSTSFIQAEKHVFKTRKITNAIPRKVSEMMSFKWNSKRT